MIPEIELYPSGEFFNPIKPDPSKIHIGDIAHALSMKCRFTGHSRLFISVAEHSVIVSTLVEFMTGSESAALAALLHDAAEAYLPDVASPVKQQAPYKQHKRAESKLEETIFFKFDVYTPFGHMIKLADHICVGIEASKCLTHYERAEHWAWVREIVNNHRIRANQAEAMYKFLEPAKAEDLFMARWEELTQ